MTTTTMEKWGVTFDKLSELFSGPATDYIAKKLGFTHPYLVGYYNGLFLGETLLNAAYKAEHVTPGNLELFKESLRALIKKEIEAANTQVVIDQTTFVELGKKANIPEKLLPKWCQLRIEEENLNFQMVVINSKGEEIKSHHISNQYENRDQKGFHGMIITFTTLILK